LIQSKWTVTIDIFHFWAIFSSPGVFIINDTLMHFTRFNNVITIVITPINEIINMSIRVVITIIDVRITIGIIGVDIISSDIVDIVTIPFSFTFRSPEWTVTIDEFVTWTVFLSPSVFTINDTLVDFTGINRSIVVIVTIFK